MLSNALAIGQRAVANAQVSINTTSNNIANAETPGYQRADAVYSSNDNITAYGNSIGTGADIVGIQANWDSFIEKQYLSASADLASSNALNKFLSQMDSLFNQSDGIGLAAAQDEFLSAWNDLATYPDSLAERQDLLGEAQSLIYSLNSTSSELKGMSDSVESEIIDQVNSANELIDSIGLLNKQIAASPENYELISNRDQAIRELDELVGVEVLTSSDGQTKIYTESGQPLVEGSETHKLAYSGAKSSESLQPTSNYDGELKFSGTSSEELMLEFETSGPDGAAQFKVSLDGGKTWEKDENGNTLLYTAGDADNSVTIAGVEISFSGGTTDHTEGDRYTITPKTGLYWRGDSGTLVNLTPMTDASGTDVANRVSSGSIAGLFKVRDDYIEPALSDLNDYTSAMVWEVNSVHSQGAGLEGHSAVEGSYGVTDQTAALNKSGLTYEDKIKSGEFTIYTYDSNGNPTSNSSISVDPATDSLDDIVASINSAFTGVLTASVNSDGEIEIQAGSGLSFEFGEDSSGFLAAAGINTFFEGSSAGDIKVNSYATENPSHINCGEVGTDGTVSSGSNDTAKTVNDLLSKEVSIGEKGAEQSSSLTEYLASLISEVGSAASTAETQVICDASAAQLYYDQQESVSGVNVDEELVNLTKYQQQYTAACQIISVTREMLDTILGIM
ncbi:flagellar hook-associated protein FlgK [Maridesulfovibrio zosterae]|uniref:flagellar hook-associated protein FlgK n=1 Tax=Maridesulfovibrio zosterae TaxID=82171 RepID=UPI00041544C7|nr:flagellar hook-associated protein FlgK [Maridesulfovibrio zosterae]